MDDEDPPASSAIDQGPDERRHAQALADIAAGRLTANADVLAWLATWGTPDETPAPR